MRSIKRQKKGDLVATDILQQIQRGDLKPDDYLLPENELAKSYRVSIRAVRDGLLRLASEGWIRRKPGQGTVVCNRTSAEHDRGVVAVILLGRIRDASTAELFDGIQQRLQSHGYAATVYVTDAEPANEMEIFNRIEGNHVAGTILFTAFPYDDYAHLLTSRAKGVRHVLIDHYFPGFECDFVSVDDRLGAYEATEHLIRIGCTDLLHLTTDVRWTSSELRGAGFADAAKDLPRENVFVRTEKHNAPLSEQLFHELLRDKSIPMRPTPGRKLGIFAVNDAIALQTIKYLQKMDIQVPKDVAVVGFNNDLTGLLAKPSLTTIAIPRQEIAIKAVDLLMERIKTPDASYSEILLTPKLVIRQSCGCYPVV